MSEDDRLKKFGEYIKSLRQNKGMTLRQLAKIVNKTPGAVSQIENGILKPSEDLIRVIASIFEEDGDVLLAMSGQVSEKLLEIIKKRPQQFRVVIEALEKAPENAFLKVVRVVYDGKW